MNTNQVLQWWWPGFAELVFIYIYINICKYRIQLLLFFSTYKTLEMQRSRELKMGGPKDEYSGEY